MTIYVPYFYYEYDILRPLLNINKRNNRIIDTIGYIMK